MLKFTKSKKGKIIKNFISFYKTCTHFDIVQTIEYFAVFDGFEDEFLPKETIFETIYEYILLRFEKLERHFLFTHDRKEFEDMLICLCRGDRKMHSVYKKCNISRMSGSKLYKNLFDIGIIKKEFSREEPLKKERKQKLKKALRGYHAEDKILFKNEFCRFWFTFIAPNIKLLKNKEFGKVLDIIKNGFEKFVSFTYEILCKKFLLQKFNEEFESSDSYWSKNVEIDIFLSGKYGKNIAAEAKWKNHLMCRNILSSLQKKCIREALGVDIFVLFSKSGFSKGLLKMQNEKLLLVDLSEFEKICKQEII
ncbi:MAG: DUF234 domain-containing protein [Campylobacteraceae bacterium]|jgi:hypothetical protein|nr:DUF234 domain-containing protein [Campylobacteraceae bacterium]